MSYLPRLADALARLSARWIPDSFTIACLLTLVTFAMAMALGQATPAQTLDAWGSGFWELLPFSMQIAVAYLGMGATFHAGPSGSVPLLLATPGTPDCAVLISNGRLTGLP